MRQRGEALLAFAIVSILCGILTLQINRELNEKKKIVVYVPEKMEHRE